MHEIQHNAAAKSPGAAEYLTFTLGSETYGIDILKVQEIRGYDSVTRIANTPDYIKGVINLRGVIVPILDLRLKFHVGEATYHEFTVVIILNALEKVVGIVVDGVSDVMALGAEQIKPPPEVGGTLATRYLTGLGATDQGMLILVDVEKLIAGDELEMTNENSEYQSEVTAA